MNNEGRKKDFDNFDYYDKSKLREHFTVGKVLDDQIYGAHKKKIFYDFINDTKNPDGKQRFSAYPENKKGFDITGITYLKYRAPDWSGDVHEKTLYDETITDDYYIEHGLQAASNFWHSNLPKKDKPFNFPPTWTSYDDHYNIWQGKSNNNTISTFYPFNSIHNNSANVNLPKIRTAISTNKDKNPNLYD